MILRAATVRATVLSLALATVAACATGDGASPDVPSPSSPPPTPTEVPVASATGLPPSAPGASPPSTFLVVAAGEPVPGMLGTSCWDNGCSDAPWLPGTDAGSLRAGSSLRITLEPLVAHGGWTASWAALVDDQPQAPVGGVAGGDGPIEVTAPDRAGWWSLYLFVRFGAGQNAAWFWRMEVVP